jgi:hypothetical protein
VLPAFVIQGAGLCVSARAMSADPTDPLEVHATRSVAADVDEVFAFLADLEQHWLIADRFVDVVELDGSPGARNGGRVRLRGPFGLRRTARTRVEFARPPVEMGGGAELSGGTVAHVRWLLRRADGRTVITLGATIENAGRLDRLLLGLGGRAWLRSRFDGALCALERHLAETPARMAGALPRATESHAA